MTLTAAALTLAPASGIAGEAAEDPVAVGFANVPPPNATRELTS